MSPIVLSTGMFLLLEGVASYDRRIAFGIAIGGFITGLIILFAMKDEKPPASPSTATKGD